MDTIDTRLVALTLMAAFGYGLATIGMKLASANWSAIAVLLIGLGFIAAMQAEIVLMRGMTLGALYMVIIAVETVLVLGFAYSIGEGLSPREALGGLVILAGLAIVAH
ncbi:5-aminolevulinate synthase [Roseovarius aestuariivivens]|uniref:5-aminolevulinate synthase n=1 Tax=Roseovarius aestuariivivens TaxID=1888910 RepID=UPI0010808B86|nr:5-aminolevulinate synthase [Roseovarius aestuariivivens]